MASAGIVLVSFLPAVFWIWDENNVDNKEKQRFFSFSHCPASWKGTAKTNGCPIPHGIMWTYKTKGSLVWGLPCLHLCEGCSNGRMISARRAVQNGDGRVRLWVGCPSFC